MSIQRKYNPTKFLTPDPLLADNCPLIPGNCVFCSGNPTDSKGVHCRRFKFEYSRQVSIRIYCRFRPWAVDRLTYRKLCMARLCGRWRSVVERGSCYPTAVILLSFAGDQDPANFWPGTSRRACCARSR